MRPGAAVRISERSDEILDERISPCSKIHRMTEGAPALTAE